MLPTAKCSLSGHCSGVPVGMLEGEPSRCNPNQLYHWTVDMMLCEIVEIQVVALKIVEYCTVGNFCEFKFSQNRPKFGFQKFSRILFSRVVNLEPAG